MSRLPIRVRLTAAFALAMTLVLVGAGLFVYLRLQHDLDESVRDGLGARAAAVASVGSAGAGARPEPDEGFSQVYDGRGRMIDAVGGARGPALRAGEVARARRAQLTLERGVAGIEGRPRILARAGARGTVIAVGQSLEDRDDTLLSLARSFAIGGALAVVLASVLGYALATAGLRPVEAMRRRAADVSLADDRTRLPLPPAHDEVRRLGETLNDMLDRLAGAYARERRFVTDASHELRTPVAVIKAELDAALRTGDREALVAAVDECDHLAQLAEDLLILARAGDGQLPVRCERVELRALLEAARERFRERAAEHGRVIEVDAPAELAANADALRLRQALANLVDNALRHGAGDVTLRARPAGHEVELEVADEGGGFDRDVAGRAFERFARGDAARTRGGAGLGLAIVAAIAEAHGGRAAILAGPGATVAITLPSHVGLSTAPYGRAQPTTGGTT